MVWSPRASGWADHPHNRRVMYPNTTGTEAPALGTLPDLTLCMCLSDWSSVSFIMSFNKLVNISISLSSVSCSSKLIEPKGRVVGPVIYRQLVRSTGDNLNLKLTPELEGSLMGLSPYLCNLMLSLGRQRQN